MSTKNSKSNKWRNNSQRKDKTVREQPRKDSKDKRINYDNAREDRVFKDMTGNKKYDNDVIWYARNPELLKSAASLPFSVVTGNPIWGKSAYSSIDARSNHVPGAMGLYWIPAFGGAVPYAIKLSADSIYSFTVHANSRNTSYNASDEMLVILAGAQVFSMLANGIRAYGTMKLFDQTTKYLPDSLISLMGFDYDDLRSNLANMWYDLNEIIASTAQIWIPNTLPILDRWFWMNSNIYMDSESVRGQYYLMVQRSFLAYDETGLSTGGRLGWIKPDGTVLAANASSISGRYDNTTVNTWKSYTTALRGLISYLLNSEDRGVIMGDILKAYGQDRIYAVKPIPVDYTVTPVYDREVLTQIENSTVFGTSYYDIRSTNGYDIAENWATNLSSGAKNPELELANASILNFHQKEIPTPAQIMVATRLKCSGYTIKSNSSSGASIAPETCGSEYVVSIVVATFTDDIHRSLEYYDTRIDDLFGSGITGGVKPENIWFYNQAFDWAPWVYYTATPTISSSTTDANKSNQTIRAAFGDYNMYTVIVTEELAKMNNTAIYSLYGVPTIQ